jgi:ubiquinone/menaquinone biosynthesis C-methylase UbiE
MVIGFDWQSLPKGSLVVDVGGGVGSQTLTLAKKYPHLAFVIQDTEATRPNAVKVSFNCNS